MHSACSPLNILGQTKMTTVVQSGGKGPCDEGLPYKKHQPKFWKKISTLSRKKNIKRWQILRTCGSPPWTIRKCSLSLMTLSLSTPCSNCVLAIYCSSCCCFCCWPWVGLANWEMQKRNGASVWEMTTSTYVWLNSRENPKHKLRFVDDDRTQWKLWKDYLCFYSYHYCRGHI